MQLLHFKTQVKSKKTVVICHKSAPDQPEGWNDDMEAMVGKPYVVHRVRGSAIELINEQGNAFTFNYKVVELYKNERNLALSLGGTRFLSEGVIHLDSLASRSLPEDFDLMVSCLNIKKDSIKMSGEVLEALQDNCPRILGVMLSNNLIERVN